MAETPHGDRFRLLTGVVPLLNGLSMAYTWGLLYSYLLTGMILQVGFSVVSLIPEQPLSSY